jgi:hypothetical protein
MTKINKMKRVHIFIVLLRCNINFAETNRVIQQERKLEQRELKYIIPPTHVEPINPYDCLIICIKNALIT